MRFRTQNNGTALLEQIEFELERFLKAYPVAATAALFAAGAVFTSFIYDATPETETRLLETLANYNGTLTETQFQQVLLYDPLLESIAFSLGLLTVILGIYYREDIVNLMKKVVKQTIDYSSVIYISIIVFALSRQVSKYSPEVTTNNSFASAIFATAGFLIGLFWLEKGRKYLSEKIGSILEADY